MELSFDEADMVHDVPRISSITDERIKSGLMHCHPLAIVIISFFLFLVATSKKIVIASNPFVGPELKFHFGF